MTVDPDSDEVSRTAAQCRAADQAGIAIAHFDLTAATMSETHGRAEPMPHVLMSAAARVGVKRRALHAERRRTGEPRATHHGGGIVSFIAALIVAGLMLFFWRAMIVIIVLTAIVLIVLGAASLLQADGFSIATGTPQVTLLMR